MAKNIPTEHLKQKSHSTNKINSMPTMDKTADLNAVR